jgi:hypothetical protein
MARITRSNARTLVTFSALLVLGACEHSKSSNPLSPTIAGPLPGVEITQPVLLEPGQGWKFKDKQQPITLLIENAATNGVRPVVYAFEIAVDSGFQTIVYSRRDVPQGDNGRTAHRLQDKLQLGRTYYWRAWAYDGANTGGQASSVSFEVYPPVVINPPQPVSPGHGGTITSLFVELRVANSGRSGPAGNVSYAYQVAKDQAFTQLVSQTGGQPEAVSAGQTAWAPGGLVHSTTYYWRAYATDGETQSGWSSTWTFRTPAPAPSGGSGSSTPCGPPYPNTHFGIIECQRSKFGPHMSSDQLVTFLRASARDMNSASLGGGPFGILRKTGGANCGGWSCDILCAGSGTAQRQWDVLGDADGAQTPAWIGPKVWPDIRVDLCEIQ